MVPREDFSLTDKFSKVWQLPPEVHKRLKHYVYVYSDPDSGVPFYVGKGKGDRVLQHLVEEKESANLMGRIVPVVICLMMEHPESLWGEPHYPLVN